MSITANTKKTQCQRLLAYLRKNRSKGITSLEAAVNLGIVCLHKRIADLEADFCREWIDTRFQGNRATITRTKELSATGSTVTRYKLAR